MVITRGLIINTEIGLKALIHRKNTKLRKSSPKIKNEMKMKIKITHQIYKNLR
jgi:hypothetical protein